MKVLKKLLCFIFSAVIAASAVLVTAGKPSAAYPGNVPIIYLHGEGSSVGTYDENGQFQRLDNMVIDKDKVVALLTENKDVFLKAFVTQNWTEVCAIIEDFMVEAYGDIALGPDGMPTDGSVSGMVINETTVRNKYNSSDSTLDKYVFDYDWRLDPTDNMERLHDYAELLLKVTGSDKYAIVGRCEGACLAVTYWETYHDPRITDIVLYASAYQGAMPIGEAFSGSLYVDSESIERFIYEADLNLNVEVTDSFTLTDDSLNAILKTASDLYGLDYACWAVNNVYEQIYNTVTPQVLRKTFATFPGFWAMCDDQYYEKAKQVIFGGAEEEYAEMIKKIDNYHYNIMNRSDEIIQSALDSGVEVSNVVKYGLHSFPLSRESAVQSDQQCRVDRAGLGTTCTNVDETFSAEYVREAVRKGNGSYISPDLVIDASTTMLKDTTWYIKNLHHQNFTNKIDPLFFEIINTQGMTVRTNEKYPQFLFFEKETEELHPLNSEEDKSAIEDYNEYSEENENKVARFFSPLLKVLYKIITVITKIFTLPARA